MKKKILQIIIISNIFLIQGCLSTALLSSAVITATSVIDTRNIKQQVNDNILEIRINNALNNDKRINENNRIIVNIYEGNVLLTGQISDYILFNMIQTIVGNIKGVKKIYNFIKHKSPMTINDIYKDIWITSKIKSKIISHHSIKLLKIKIITEDKEVFLFGKLPKKESSFLKKIVSDTNEVKKIITISTNIN